MGALSLTKPSLILKGRRSACGLLGLQPRAAVGGPATLNEQRALTRTTAQPDAVLDARHRWRNDSNNGFSLLGRP